MDYATPKAARIAGELRRRGFTVTEHCALSGGARIGVAFRFPSGKERGLTMGADEASADAFVTAYNRQLAEFA